MTRTSFAVPWQDLLKELMRPSNNLGKHEMQKAVWTHKYDMVRTSCRCACTKGFFKPVLEKQGEVTVDQFGEESDERPLDPAERRKREIEAKLAKKQAAEKAQKEKVTFASKGVEEIMK